MGFSEIDWAELFSLSMSPAELIVRGSAIYWFLFLIFRFILRRDVGSVGVADILILVIVADASQNAMAGEYKTVSDGMILISTLIFWNVALDWISFRSAFIRRFVTSPPLCLVREGVILRKNMRKEFITDEELWSKLRQNEIESLDQVKAAYMEQDGGISVIKRKQ
jgi:uncharacterized membrane protein YcaP (DUF421 family)